MTPFDDLNKPLKDYFPINRKCLNKDVSCLREVSNEDDYKPSVTRIINALHNNNYHILHQVLHAKGKEIKKIRNLGKECQSLLYSLLKRVSENPSAVINYFYVHPVKNSPTPSTTQDDNPSAVKPHKNTRKEEIEARLRQLGFII